MTTYTVKAGDSLSLIAERMLGDLSRWPEIAKLNGITNVNLITPGQTLELPDPAAALNQAHDPSSSPSQSEAPASKAAAWSWTSKKSIVIISLVVIIVSLGILIYKKYGK